VRLTGIFGKFEQNYDYGIFNQKQSKKLSINGMNKKVVFKVNLPVYRKKI
jgi:hypothetical protein